MKYLFPLLLFIIEYNSLLCLKSGDQIRSYGVNGSYSSNNLKVNNQMKIKTDILNVGSVPQIGIINKTKDIFSYNKDNVKGMSEEYNIGSNSLRTSDIIYNGTQVLTLVLFITLLLVGLFILVIIAFPKYARRFGFKQRKENDNSLKHVLTNLSLQEESSNKNVNSEHSENSLETNKSDNCHFIRGIGNKDNSFGSISNSKNQIVRNLALTLNRNKNYSLRRHSLVSDESSDNCKIISRPRSSSSLPFVKAFTDTMDESTTSDESICGANKANVLKNFLKKRNNSNMDTCCNGNKNVECTENSGRIVCNSLKLGDEDETNNSPTSASAVVAIQMSELLARWNPKKDSRLIQKSNFSNNIKGTNNNIILDKMGNKISLK